MKETHEQSRSYCAFGDIGRLLSPMLQQEQAGAFQKCTFHPVFHFRTLNQNGTLLTLDRAQFFAGFSGSGSPWGSHAKLTMIQVFEEDFGMARTDDIENGRTALFTLFKVKGHWLVAGLSAIDWVFGTREPQFNPHDGTQLVLEMLNEYYEAVDQDQPALLSRPFHPDWRMKNPENGDIAAEAKDKFGQRLYGHVNQGYKLDRQVTDCQVLFDSMAWVRVDKPSTPVTTVFTFFKLGDVWKMVDKAWSFIKPKS